MHTVKQIISFYCIFQNILIIKYNNARKFEILNTGQNFIFNIPGPKFQIPSSKDIFPYSLFKTLNIIPSGIWSFEF